MKYFFCLIGVFFLTSCNNSKNSQEFINTTKGKYLFNSNETLEVYFIDDILNITWRGKKMTPVKANDSSFYVKEMNEKLIFISFPKIHIELAVVFHKVNSPARELGKDNDLIWHLPWA